MKSALAGLKALEGLPDCNVQCQEMVQDSISKLEPALENRIANHSSQKENLKELTGILATVIVMNENGLIDGRSTSAGSGKGAASGTGSSKLDEVIKGNPKPIAKDVIGAPVYTAKNPLSPVQQRDAYGNEIVYRTMSPKQYERFLNTGVMPATTETSVSYSLNYSSKYEGITVKIAVKPGTFSELEKIGIAANKAASKEFPNMSTQTGKWMDTNTRFKVEGGQMTTQLGQGQGMDIFNKNIVHFEKVQ